MSDLTQILRAVESSTDLWIFDDPDASLETLLSSDEPLDCLRLIAAELHRIAEGITALALMKVREDDDLRSAWERF